MSGGFRCLRRPSYPILAAARNWEDTEVSVELLEERGLPFSASSRIPPCRLFLFLRKADDVHSRPVEATFFQGLLGRQSNRSQRGQTYDNCRNGSLGFHECTTARALLRERVSDPSRRCHTLQERATKRVYPRTRERCSDPPEGVNFRDPLPGKVFLDSPARPNPARRHSTHLTLSHREQRPIRRWNRSAHALFCREGVASAKV